MSKGYIKRKCPRCGQLKEVCYVFLESANRVYPSMYCEDCTKEVIKETVPITACLFGETVRIVKPEELRRKHSP